MNIYDYVRDNLIYSSEIHWKKIIDTALNYNENDKEKLMSYTFYLTLKSKNLEASKYLILEYFKGNFDSFFENNTDNLIFLYKQLKDLGIIIPKKYIKKSIILLFETLLEDKEKFQEHMIKSSYTRITKDVKYVREYFNEFPEELEDKEFDEIKKYVNNGVFKKYGKGPYFGCELEIVFHNKNDRQNCLNDLWDHKFGFHLAYEKDVADIGFEIVTDVFGFENIILLFKKIFKIIKKYNAYCSQKCGFHIHIDNTYDVLEKCKKIFTIENRKSLNLIGLREMNSSISETGITVDKHDDFSTIEIRIFRCTTILRNVIKYIIFTNDIITKDIDTINKKYNLLSQ